MKAGRPKRTALSRYAYAEAFPSARVRVECIVSGLRMPGSTEWNCGGLKAANGSRSLIVLTARGDIQLVVQVRV
jgi:FixJ family two-component response regulator